MNNIKFNHIDCFSGPGGICTGFRAAGLKTLLAIEKVDTCVETYSANHPEVDVINKDIRKVTEQEILNSVGKEKIHIVTSGMPCETFSTAGSTSRASYDFRQQLYSEAIRVASIVDSEMILFENVPAITSKKVRKGGSRLIIQDIKLELIQNGYSNFLDVVLDSSRYGVPQKRKRYFLLASKNDTISLKFPEPLDNEVTVEDAFKSLPHTDANDPKEDFPKLKAKNKYIELLNDRQFWNFGNNSYDNKLTYHKAPKHRENTIERFKLIESGENLKDLFLKYTDSERTKLQAKGILPKKWYIQRNYRLPLYKPSKTITSHCLDELIHPILNRGLTVREVSRLQSFPDFYDFKGGPYLCPHYYEKQDKYEQIGDAVPPLLAYHWGKTITELLKKEDEKLSRVLLENISN